MQPAPPVGGTPQYTIPAPQYTPPPAPVAPAAPPYVQPPAPPRVEQNYNPPAYNPPAYTPPKYVEPETPKPAPVRPRPVAPQDNYEERNRFSRPIQPRVVQPDDVSEDRHERSRPQPRAPRGEDGLADDYVAHPWNKPIAKGVPPCGEPPLQGSVCGHRVEAGETLSSIAQAHYGFSGPRTMAKIAAANPGLNPDRIYIGQFVYLPCGSCGSGTSAPSTVRQPERETTYRNENSGRRYNENAQYIPISAY